MPQSLEAPPSGEIEHEYNLTHLANAVDEALQHEKPEVIAAALGPLEDELVHMAGNHTHAKLPGEDEAVEEYLLAKIKLKRKPIVHLNTDTGRVELGPPSLTE